MNEAERQALIDTLSEPALRVGRDGVLLGANTAAIQCLPFVVIGEAAASHVPKDWGKREVALGEETLWLLEAPSGSENLSCDGFGDSWLALFENEAVAMVLADAKNQIVRANAAFCRWSGFSVEELEGTPILRFVHPEDVEEAVRRIRLRFMGQDVPAVNDFRCVTRKGEVHDIRVGTMSVPNSPLFVYTVLDIRPEVKAAELNARYATLLESTGVGITVVGLDTTINYVNGRFLELTGYAEDELVGVMKGFDLLTPKSRRAAVERTKMRIEKHPDWVMLRELELVRKDGSILHALTTNTPVPGTDDLMLSFMDISQRKEAEKELADRLAHEELLSQVSSRFLNLTVDMHEPRLQEALDLIRSRYGVDRLSVHVFRDGEDGLKTFTSAARDALPSLLRNPENSPTWKILRAYSNSVLLRPDLPPPPGFEMLKSRMLEDGIVFFYAMPHKAGSHRFLLSLESRRETAWSDRDFSNLDTLCMVIANVIERIDAETSRSSIERKLWEAHKLESVGVLAGGIAHDFNNILVALLGNAEMARASLDDRAFAEECLDDLLLAGARARDLVSQILTFSRQSDVQAEPVSLFRVCEEAVSMLRASIPSTVAIHADLQATSGMVTGNFTRLLQVVMNLCTNAYQAIHASGGPGEIHLRLGKVKGGEHDTFEPDREYCRIVVEDNGPGVPENLLPRIFDPFFTTKNPGEGTGMGLSVVHGIVTSYHGSIHAENRPEGGARFSVFFPATTGKLAEGVQQVVDSIEAGAGETILVVDDDPGVLKLMRSMLKSLKYEVVTCGDPEEALHIFAEKAEELDLVITDLTMPGMTGNDVARAIKRMDPETTVVACSGYSRSGIDTEVIDGFIAKPFQRAQLSEVIRAALEGRLLPMELV